MRQPVTSVALSAVSGPSFPYTLSRGFQLTRFAALSTSRYFPFLPPTINAFAPVVRGALRIAALYGDTTIRPLPPRTCGTDHAPVACTQRPLDPAAKRCCCTPPYLPWFYGVTGHIDNDTSFRSPVSISKKNEKWHVSLNAESRNDENRVCNKQEKTKHLVNAIHTILDRVILYTTRQREEEHAHQRSDDERQNQTESDGIAHDTDFDTPRHANRDKKRKSEKRAKNGPTRESNP